MEHDMCYDGWIEEVLAEIIFLAETALAGLMCHHCHRMTVHEMFRENPDGSIDEVGKKCRKCGKVQ